MAIKINTNSLNQQTLSKPVHCVGIGLHTGQKVSIIIQPAEENTGINFIRKDSTPGQGFITGRWYNVTDTRMSTTIGNEYGVTIQTIEHLMAALRGCGIDNALIEVDGPEIPIMDGSSAPFVEIITSAGIKELDEDRNIIWIQRPIEYKNGEKYAILMPDTDSKFTAEIHFDNTLIGTQMYSYSLSHDAFSKSISRARTFGFANEINALCELGLIKGGSLSNAIVVDDDEILNNEGLRYSDEFVRHKILDCVGDFALVGHQVVGHYFAKKPGHELNNQFIKTLFDNRSAWSYITVREYNKMFGIKQKSADSTYEYREKTRRQYT